MPVLIHRNWRDFCSGVNFCDNNVIIIFIQNPILPIIYFIRHNDDKNQNGLSVVLMMDHSVWWTRSGFCRPVSSQNLTEF